MRPFRLLPQLPARGGGVAVRAKKKGPDAPIEDLAAPFAGDACDCETSEPDGFDDLSLKFSSPALTEELQLDEVPGDSLVELVLEGELADGTPFSAADCIWIVPGADNGKGPPDSDQLDRLLDDVSLLAPVADCGAVSPGMLLATAMSMLFMGLGARPRATGGPPRRRR